LEKLDQIVKSYNCGKSIPVPGKKCGLSGLKNKASRQNYENQKNYIYVNGDKTIFTYFR